MAVGKGSIRALPVCATNPSGKGAKFSITTRLVHDSRGRTLYGRARIRLDLTDDSVPETN